MRYEVAKIGTTSAKQPGTEGELGVEEQGRPVMVQSVIDVHAARQIRHVKGPTESETGGRPVTDAGSE